MYMQDVQVGLSHDSVEALASFLHRVEVMNISINLTLSCAMGTRCGGLFVLLKSVSVVVDIFSRGLIPLMIPTNTLN